MSAAKLPNRATAPPPTPPLMVRLGCGHLLVSLVVACFLLAINGVTVASLHQAWAGFLPKALQNARIAQAILFLGPIVLLAVQWWAFDVIVDWVRPLRRVKRDRAGRVA